MTDPTTFRSSSRYSLIKMARSDQRRRRASRRPCVGGHHIVRGTQRQSPRDRPGSAPGEEGDRLPSVASIQVLGRGPAIHYPVMIVRAAAPKPKSHMRVRPKSFGLCTQSPRDEGDHRQHEHVCEGAGTIFGRRGRFRIHDRTVPVLMAQKEGCTYRSVRRRDPVEPHR